MNSQDIELQVPNRRPRSRKQTIIDSEGRIVESKGRYSREEENMIIPENNSIDHYMAMPSTSSQSSRSRQPSGNIMFVMNQLQTTSVLINV